MEWVITIVSRGQNVYKMFAARFYHTLFTILLQYLLPYVSQEASLQWFLQYFSLSTFTIFLHYFPFTNTFFTLIPVSYTSVPVLFLFFLQCTYLGEDWGSGLTFIYSLRFLILFLNLAASHWDYLNY